MGVAGLWKILNPCRIQHDSRKGLSSIESHSGMRIAVDASIWIYQAMLQERKRSVLPRSTTSSNHLILALFLRRIAQLLFYGMRPVIVFDGRAPSAKRSTLRQREVQRKAIDLRNRARRLLQLSRGYEKHIEPEQKKLRVDQEAVSVQVNTSESDGEFEEDDWEEEISLDRSNLVEPSSFSKNQLLEFIERTKSMQSLKESGQQPRHHATDPHRTFLLEKQTLQTNEMHVKPALLLPLLASYEKVHQEHNEDEVDSEWLIESDSDGGHSETTSVSPKVLKNDVASYLLEDDRSSVLSSQIDDGSDEKQSAIIEPLDVESDIEISPKKNLIFGPVSTILDDNNTVKLNLPKPPLTRVFSVETPEELPSMDDFPDLPTSQVSSDTLAEIKELLNLLGVPFLDSPSEAEAQCAALEMAKLVDAVITDDSDVFLFGARRVLRHVFSNKRCMEEYRMTEIERFLNLTRARLIDLASLLGCDYCEGVPRIGPILATRIIQAFASEADPLVAFSSWIKSGHGSNKNLKLVNITLPDNFDPESVRRAFQTPLVQTESTLEWRSIRLEPLIKFVQERMSWTRDQVEKLILPVTDR